MSRTDIREALEKAAERIYMLDPHYESGEYVEGYQVSPGGYLSWEQAKAHDAEFGDDPRMLKITDFAYKAARAALSSDAGDGSDPRLAAADFLFGLLDDIDTASDMAKSDDKLYRALVHRSHRRRFEVASTDGYSVTFRERSRKVSDAASPEGAQAPEHPIHPNGKG